MKQLTVRGVPDEVAERLQSMSKAQGMSVNSIVVNILRAAVGVDRRQRRLERYATWTKDDLREFEEALELQRNIDEALWH